jgi:hypothetical protein
VLDEPVNIVVDGDYVFVTGSWIALDEKSRFTPVDARVSTEAAEVEGRTPASFPHKFPHKTEAFRQVTTRMQESAKSAAGRLSERPSCSFALAATPS